VACSVTEQTSVVSQSRSVGDVGAVSKRQNTDSLYTKRCPSHLARLSSDSVSLLFSPALDHLFSLSFSPSPSPSYLQCFRTLCCKGQPPPRPEYDLVCIGLTGSGKTSLLSRLCSEATDNIGPTTGEVRLHLMKSQSKCSLYSSLYSA
jgi:hypothetical protein